VSAIVVSVICEQNVYTFIAGTLRVVNVSAVAHIGVEHGADTIPKAWAQVSVMPQRLEGGGVRFAVALLPQEFG
jgi:hypothetical protein